MIFDISEVVLADATKTIQHRDKKLFVRISVTNEKFLIINSRKSKHCIRIQSATYSFLTHDSYIDGFRTFDLKKGDIIKKRGNLNYDDMIEIYNMIRISKFISKDEKEEIVSDLDEFINNYTENKLKSKFKKK